MFLMRGLANSGRSDSLGVKSEKYMLCGELVILGGQGVVLIDSGNQIAEELVS